MGRNQSGLGFLLTRTTLKEPYFRVLPYTYMLPQFYLQLYSKILLPTEYFLAVCWLTLSLALLLTLSILIDNN